MCVNKSQFCFPQGVQLQVEARAPTFFIFTLTGNRRRKKKKKKKIEKKISHKKSIVQEVDGGKFYGAALTYHRAIVRTFQISICDNNFHSKSQNFTQSPSTKAI
jgi:predicted AlkP superfamily phosphohydrolase/phosphomutase